MYTPSTIQGAAGSARRVLEVLETRPRGGRPARRAAARPAVRGHVRLENVTFGYEPGRPVLHDVIARGAARRDGGHRRRHRRGQEHAGRAWSRASSTRGRAASLLDGHDLRDVQLQEPAVAGGARAAGAVPVPDDDRREHRLRPARRASRARSRRRRGRPTPTSSSSGCRRATTRSSASAARRSRAASGSGCRSPARC